MVRGLDLFRKHFSGFEDQYILIGGAACYLAMEDAGLDFRVTKDLDIVLCVEALDGAFVKLFWDFIKEGRYKNRQQSTGKQLFYRFDKPERDDYPWMLELFSRKPDALALSEEAHLTPIPTSDELSSLSAILMDEGYYEFIHASKRRLHGVMAATPECLIPLKAKAWMDLRARKQAGENIDERSIKKHRNDIFKIFQLLTLDTRIKLPRTIREDMTEFLAQLKRDPVVDLKPFGMPRRTMDDVMEALQSIYGLNG